MLTVRQEMLEAARRGAAVLPDPAATARFVAGRQNADGGFRGRADHSDLYYTLFGLECLDGLECISATNSGAGLPTSADGRFNANTCRNYLARFAGADSLDLVHVCCLARCWSILADGAPPQADAIAARIESFRGADGLYGGSVGGVYASFLAVGALQDLGRSIPNAEMLLAGLAKFRSADGGFSNMPGSPMGLTAATAAAVVLLENQGRLPIPEHGGCGHAGREHRGQAPISANNAEISASPHSPLWLAQRCLPEGGFQAAAGVPMSDLLSTATALHALSVVKDLQLLSPANLQACRRFVLSLARPDGGFAGQSFDTAADVEYTWYAMLALGHLPRE